jgi:hypothetical protein
MGLPCSPRLFWALKSHERSECDLDLDLDDRRRGMGHDEGKGT